VSEGEAGCVSSPQATAASGDSGEPAIGDEDQLVELGAEGAQERLWGLDAGSYESEVTAVGRQGTEEAASRGPGVGTSQASEAAVVVETVEVEARGTLDEGEEAVVHARSSSAARRT
jgi:hypothetical protein